MKQKLIFTGLLILGLVLFFFTIQKTGWNELWETLKHFSILGFFVYLTVSVSNFCLFTYRWYSILKVFVKEISFKHLFWYRMTGYAVSYITPAAQIGGEPARMYFLKKEEKIPLKTGISTVLIDKTLEICINLFFILLGFFVAVFIGIDLAEIGIIAALTIFIAMMIYAITAIVRDWGIISTFLIKFRLHKIKAIHKNLEKIQIMEKKITHFFRDHPKVLIKCIFVSLFIQSFILLENYIILSFLGFEPTLIQVFLIATIPNIAYLIPTPAAIGTLEGTFALLFKLLNIAGISAIAYVLIVRLRDLIYVVFGMVYGCKHGLSIWSGEGKDEE